MKIGIHKEPSGKGLGGTEFCVAVLAEELSQYHEVDIVHHQDWLTKEHLTTLFGCQLQRAELRFVPPEPWYPSRSRLPWNKLRDAQRRYSQLSEPYELFVSFTHGEDPPPFCHAGYGMLVVLFPIWDAGKNARIYEAPAAEGSAIRNRIRRWYYTSEWTKRLASYGLKTAISHFAQSWTRRLWGVECEIFNPPVRTNFEAREKENLVLSVGRFTAFKKQLEMVEAFRRLTDLHSKGWRFCCVGPSENTPEDRLYSQCVVSLAADRPISVRSDVSHAELKALYERAKIFWHAAGYGEDLDQRPDLAEHFGIVTAEAMAAGCVPVALANGGQPEIVAHGTSGFLWSRIEELMAYTTLLARDECRRAAMAKAAVVQAQNYGVDSYLERFYTYFPQLRPAQSAVPTSS